MNKSIILLKNLLRSTSRLNSYRYCRDRKKRKKIAGALIGQGILYLLFMAFCIVICVGYGKFGLAGSIPVMCATVISGMAFFLTFFKTNGYLFGFRDYDMLMSLPFGIKNIAM